MASASNTTGVIHSSGKMLVSLNAASQFSLKLTRENYPAWRAQIVPVLRGHNLMGYVDGSFPCPSQGVQKEGKEVPNSDHEFWVCQDQLILAAIIASTSFSFMHVVSSAETSAEAWNKIKSSCANRNATRILSLREKLANLKRENRSVSDYLQTVKAISEDLAISGSPIPKIDLVIHVLNGVGSDFRDIAAAVRARDTVISFEALQEKLLSHELYLKRINSIDDPAPVVAHNVRKNSNNRQNFSNNRCGRQEYSFAQNSSRQYSGQTTNKRGSGGSSILCQICELPGHGAKRCFRAKEFFKDNFPQPRANQVTAAEP